MNGHGIGWAIKQIKAGKRVTRPGWNGEGAYIFIDPPQSTAFDPCITMYTAQRRYQPGWLASQPDLLATDWMLAPGEKEEEDEPWAFRNATWANAVSPGCGLSDAQVRGIVREYIESCDLKVDVTVIHPELS